MRGKRVVVTGLGAVSPFGEGVSAMYEGVRDNRCALTTLPEYKLEGLSCRVAGLVPPLQEKRIPRELRRSMSPMSIFACLAAWEALTNAGLSTRPGQRMGVAVGSTVGSPTMLHEFFEMFLREHSVESMRSTVFFKVMSHTVAANVALACGCAGRTLAPAAACASGLMSLCLGFEAIAAGREEMMLCGGADEFHLLTSATFDRLALHRTQKTRIAPLAPLMRSAQALFAAKVRASCCWRVWKALKPAMRPYWRKYAARPYLHRPAASPSPTQLPLLAACAERWKMQARNRRMLLMLTPTLPQLNSVILQKGRPLRLFLALQHLSAVSKGTWGILWRPAARWKAFCV